jgi:hypothetical protein
MLIFAAKDLVSRLERKERGKDLKRLRELLDEFKEEEVKENIKKLKTF